ncbi:MAG TPA: hypothetical protein VN706_21220 [Gemmatimonadaceae bacterium]|nr:hypothetical protein [Gemmatimonadaceae bacterium]
MTRALQALRTTTMFAAGLAAAACASSGAAARQVHTTVHVEPTAPVVQPQGSPAAVSVSQPGQPAGAAPALPQVATAAGPQLSAAPERRIREINVPDGTPIATAVTQLGSQLGLTVTVDPAVHGTAHANLRNVTLEEALHELVSRNGAQYQLQGTVLRVVPIRMESHTFHLDYVALSRIGTMSTVVQRRLSSAGVATPGTNTGLSALGAGAAAAASGGDVLTAQSVADVWQDIRVALTGIMASGQPAQGTASGNANNANAPTTGAAGESQTSTGGINAAQQAASGAGGGPSASNTVFGDGSSLVISPMAGLINVTAMPDKVARVQEFLDDFQASVLRQVMIEAKIVEVTLTKTFQYGIDWSIVSAAASNKFGVTLRSDPSVTTTGNAGNINFTFTGGATSVTAVLTALASEGNVSVLSNEQTSALNNQRAIFDVTTDEIFFNVSRTPLLGPNGGVVTTQSSIIPQQISVGVVLDVLPQISADNVLTMDIRPAVTSIDHTATISLPDGTTASAPVIARREGDTIARMRAGETMVIGGLVQNRKDQTTSGIPVLKDIPLLGKAFQHIDNTETRTELVVFLTPTIISGQPASGR